MAKNEIIGMTTMIPVECIFSAGYIPLDLNNAFINHDNPSSLIEKAEDDGLPRNICSWVKGMYGFLMENSVKKIIIPVLGDCSNCITLGEILEYKGFDIYYFSYNRSRDPKILKRDIESLANYLGTSFEDSKSYYNNLIPLRKKINELDYIAFTKRSIPSDILFNFQVSSSDFNSDPEKFSESLNELIKKDFDQRMDLIPIGVSGVPHIMSDFPEILEKLGARSIFYETPRQFSLPYFDGFLDAYINYTYPYSFSQRLDSLKLEIKRRNLKGLIHYVQSFCHRQIEIPILKKELDIPILFLEGESPEKVNAQQLMRLESFISIIA